MTFTTDYDIPQEVATQSHSSAFATFLRNWFGNSWALTRGEVDLSFLNDLTPEERELAKDLLRPNLRIKRRHIIEGVAALGDIKSVLALEAMFASEANPSWQLIIAGPFGN